MLLTQRLAEQMKRKVTSQALHHYGKKGNLPAIKFHLSELTHVEFEVPKHIEIQTIELLQQKEFGLFTRVETLGGNILLIGSTEW